ncbi:MAG: uroporphyrinogen-III synthase [Pararhodobacter sp.]
MPTQSAPPPRPLLLLTRPRAQSERFAASCRAHCPPHDRLIAPLTEVVTVAFDPQVLAGAAGLVLTSPNAVMAIGGLALPRGLPAWCVGPGTAAAAREAGLAVHESGGDAAHLLADLRRARPAGPLVHVHGRHLARDLVRELRADGVAITGIVAYAAERCPWPEGVIRALARPRVIAPLFSPRAAREFSDRLAGRAPAGMSLLTISANCAAQLPDSWAGHITIAARPDADAMIDAISNEMSRPRPQP